MFFFVGFASDFLITSYYQFIQEDRIFAAVVSNAALMILNVLFIGLVIRAEVLTTIVYVGGQSVGICAAIKLKRWKIERTRE